MKKRFRAACNDCVRIGSLRLRPERPLPDPLSFRFDLAGVVLAERERCSQQFLVNTFVIDVARTLDAQEGAGRV